MTDEYCRKLSNGNILPKGIHDNQKLAEAQGQAYKSINAPFGALAMASLKVSTAALKSTAPGDTEYLSLENEIQTWTEQRDSLAAQMKSILEAGRIPRRQDRYQASSEFDRRRRRTCRTSRERGQ